MIVELILLLFLLFALYGCLSLIDNIIQSNGLFKKKLRNGKI